MLTTTSEAKHTRALKIEEILKTNKTNNLSDNIKDDDGETSKEKLKDIPNTAVITAAMKQNEFSKLCFINNLNMLD